MDNMTAQAFANMLRMQASRMTDRTLVEAWTDRETDYDGMSLDAAIVYEVALAREITERPHSYIPAIYSEVEDLLSEVAGRCHEWHTFDCGV